MRVLRVYHGGRDPAHRARERALTALGVDVTLVVPKQWPESGAEAVLSDEQFEIIELPVARPGDVNRHTYRDSSAISRLLATHRPDVLDLHAEPVSLAARQWLRLAGAMSVTMYTAQNVDKRFPPPFAQYESAALRRIDGLYPCTRQAAAVARGKGYNGPVAVLPLGVDSAYRPGLQASTDAVVQLGLIGRLVPEKGVLDAVRVLADVSAHRSARLTIVGEGPEEHAARALAETLGVAGAVDFSPWRSADALAALYRQMHVVLIPSRATETWVEQFGRIIVEAQASGAVVVGYASGAIPEVGSSAALLVPEGSVEQLGATVRRLLEAPAQYTHLRAAGLERAHASTWASVAQQQMQFCTDVLTRTTLPRRLSPSQRSRRQQAFEEFGAAAVLAGGSKRPFALPVLRRDNALTRAAGKALDSAVHLFEK